MATGTRLMQEISDQFLNCKICFENFREPKTLSCLHTFCCDCLQNQYDSELSSRSSRYAIYSRAVTCPLCRKRTELPTGGVRRLPDNFLVSNLTNVLAKKTSVKVPPCDICHSVRGRVLEASSKCLDCNKVLCKGCVDMHMATKVTQLHSLIDLEGEKNIECKVHPEENIRFYCEPCECCICVVCTFQEHKDHDVCSLSDGFNKHKYSLDELLDRSKERMETVEARLQSIKKYETVVTGVKEKIRDIAISYIAQIRSKERELIKTMEEVYGDKMKELMESKPVLEENIEELQNACNLTDIMLKDKGVELLLLKKELSSKMTHLLDLPLPEVPDYKKYEVAFEPGETVLGNLSFGKTHAHNDFDKSILKQNKIKDGLIEEQKKVLEPDLITSCTQTDACNTNEISTSMASDMRVAFSNTNAQTDLTKTAIEELYTKQNELIKQQKDQGTQKKTQETTPPPDLLPASSFTYTPGKWIRSRKIQTDICSLDFHREMTDREYVHALLVVETYHDPKKGQRSPQPQRNNKGDSQDGERPTRRMSNASTMTLQDGSNGITETTRKRTTGRRDAGVNAVCDSVAIDTQTPVKVMKDSLTLTDAQDKEDKYTSMPPANLVDKETATTRVYLEERSTYTDAVSTSDRATSTIGIKQLDKSVATVPAKTGNAAIQVIPETKCMSSNTSSVQTKDTNMQTIVNTVDRGTVPDLEIEKKYSKEITVLPETSVTSPPKPTIPKRPDVTLCDRACDAIKFPTSTKATETTKTKTVSTASGTPTLTCVDRDTSTNVTKTLDQWTETVTPQLVSTGVTPPRPATLDVGVATEVINTNDEATCTEVKSYRSLQTETTLVVCDMETITDHPMSVDAQTSVEINTESTETETDPIDFGYLKPVAVSCDSHATQCEGPALQTRETNTSRNRRKTKESQTEYSFTSCQTCRQLGGGLDNDGEAQREVIGDPNKVESKQTTSNATHEVGTMAMSCLTRQDDANNQETGVQTQSPLQLDKSSATSFEFTEDFLVRTLSKEFQDAATSTESLPYIGLLSEIDVDELIVIPEANFELVSDSESDLGKYDVEMVDSETCTEYLQYVETGTQTLGIMLDNDDVNMGESAENAGPNSERVQYGKGLGEIIKSMVESEGGGGSVFNDGDAQNKALIKSVIEDPRITKHLVSIGVNTAPKLTFEKETCTPMRNLYSKGTMTLCVTKLDKSKNTLSPSGTWDRSKSGSREMGKAKSVDKVTMTTRAEHKDVGVETDKTDIDGRIENCISKLRNVSQRLNSPTSRKPIGASFFDKGTTEPNSANTSSDELNNRSLIHDSATSIKIKTNENVNDSNANKSKENHTPNNNESDNSSTKRSKDSKESTTKRNKEKKDDVSYKINDKKDTSNAITKTNDIVSIRKPQPITTLKGRKSANVRPSQDTPSSQKDGTTYDSKSLPRQFVLNRPRQPVKMGSQPLSPTRLPLHRYNSAPDQMTSVPPHTISTKPQGGRISPKQYSKSPSPRTSPTKKIPITKKLSPTERSVTTPPTDQPLGQCTKKPCAPDDIWIKKPSSPTENTSSNNDNHDPSGTRPKLRRPLPSITETRTPSTCSETSILSLASTHSTTSTVDSSVTITTPKAPANSVATPHQSTSSTKSDDGSSSSRPTKHKPSSSISSAMTSSMMTSISESLTDSVFKKSSTETLHSAASSDTLEEPTAPSSQKKSGIGFMQRFLGKRKKNQDQQKDKSSTENSSSSAGKSHQGSSVPQQTPATAKDPQSLGASSQLSPHQNVPPPESKSPTTSRKSRPFVYVRQRIFSTQQDNVEEVDEKRAQKGDNESTKKSHDCVSSPKPSRKEIKKTEKEKTASASSHEKEKVNAKEGKGGKSKKPDPSKSKVECKHGKGAKKK